MFNMPDLWNLPIFHLFASLSITFDKPFLVGDFLILDDYLGSVEQIGIKSTRLRSLIGEQIILSNAELLKSRVRNYGRMVQRRVVMTHNVTYDMDIQQQINLAIHREFAARGIEFAYPTQRLYLSRVSAAAT